MGARWPNTISNEDFYAKTIARLITEEVKRRRWRSIGHVLRLPITSIARVVLCWTPK